MAFVRLKTINGRQYKYLVESRREGAKVRQIYIRYVGADGKQINESDLSQDYKNPGSWHTKRERELITQFGGSVKKGYGFDGFINGLPVEVRSARADNRFRIQENIHKKILSRNGYYIFDVKGKKPVLLKARDVDKMLGSGAWFEDRGYSHKFLTVEEIWQGV